MCAVEEKPCCVVFGAGALGLGFLGPELGGDFRMVYVDIPQKAGLLTHLHAAGQFVINETGPSARSVRVGGADAIAADDTSAVGAALAAAEIVFTAVGEPNLRRIAPVLAGAVCRRTPGAPLRILCCENGVEIAARLAEHVEHELGKALGGRARIGDTVMGRMCRIVPPPLEGLEPVGQGVEWAVAAEPFFGIPVEKSILEGLEPVPAAFQAVAAEEFCALEDVKMFAHNGLHAFLAFLGHLRGRQFFCELREEPEVIEMAGRLLLDEVGQALFAKHGPALDRNYYLNYVPAILRRITCPGLHDSIARGIRGAMRKLEPWERMVYSLRSVAQQGIVPEMYATGLAAGILVAVREGETNLSFHEVLTSHCALDEEQERDLIALVERKREFLEKQL